MIDKSGMLKTAASTPEMIREAALLGEAFPAGKAPKFDDLIIAGMGGSAMGGEVASFFLPELPIFVNRNYTLPEFTGPRSLLLALSYSGDTDETLSCVREAKQKKMPVICITSGGKLLELARKENYPCLQIPPGLQPRAALPYLAIPVLKLFEKWGFVKELQPKIEETIRILNDLKESYLKDDRNNPVMNLARKLQGKLPILFASTGLTEIAGKRLKTQFNENSKQTAHLAVFPELDHNEIVNLAELKRSAHNFSLVLLRDEDDHSKVQKSIEIVKSLIGGNLGGVNELVSTGRSRLARLFSLIYFGDLLSVNLAILNNIDPTPVDIITRFKKELMR